MRQFIIEYPKHLEIEHFHGIMAKILVIVPEAKEKYSLPRAGSRIVIGGGGGGGGCVLNADPTHK